MLDAVGQIAWFGSAITWPAVFLLSLYWLRDRPSVRRVAAATCIATETSISLAIFSLSIVLRDGMGPDSVRGYGATAILRTTEGFFGFFYAVPFGVLAWWLARRRRADGDRPSRQPDR